MLASCPYIKQTFSAFILIFYLAGCATPPKPTVSLNSAAHQLSLEQQDHWLIKGKLGFKSPEKKQSANFRWQQTQDQYQLNMTSIIGTSLLNMRGDDEGVTLVADDETYQDADASHLIWRVTGWQIPVEKLRFWIKGQHQNKDQVITSEQGWVSQLQPICDNCENWLINYDNYKLVDKVWLPHKVVLNNSLNNSQLLIRINTWDLHE
ncbi:lipoprotein insertase outer membrane protein LolB [Paraglaciecola arctica]|uniref:Outer-membrane lipoprotein LolB n=1 Tax=Paraglaciecola arctica BSs20135 TaxID=493475 RepID=K6YEF6_9ALTE|nr:lipoprotein insertase outer membrane protein LolB [Paraglaciecola arctica]GAC22316.1 outer membrane lipoprotein LolB [Paraglaciecola arctica BSs20135]